MSLIARVSRMDRREVTFRAVSAGRELAQRISVRLRRPEWDWTRADAVLSRPFAVEGRPRLFPLHPADARPLSAVIRERFPASAESARRSADRILDGRLHILGYPDVYVGAEIDWHRDPVHGREAPRVFWSAVPFLDPAIGDHKIIWEINRHQHWLALGRAAWLTGDRTYAGAIVPQLESWLDQNPPLTGINWASMLELAFRSLSWIWTISFLAADPEDKRPWLPRMLVALDAQLEHIRHNLSHYFSPNTHLLGEALALYVAGRALPELRRAPIWADAGRRILLDQIDRQIHADGGHAELSAHYHRYAFDFYLLALSVARLTNDEEAVARFEEVAARLARYARALADDRGHLPLIGDDDGGQLFPICRRDPADATASLAWAAALLGDPSLAIDPCAPPEEAFWLLAGDPSCPAWRPSRPPEALRVDVLPDSGYAVARTARGDHLVFDAGRHGFLNGGHAHDDALSCVVTLGRRPLLVDPGTSTYTMDPGLRDRMRASTSHNTVAIDGRSHSEPSGPFHWRTRVDATLLHATVLQHGIWIAGEHDAFAPLVHRRDLLVTDDGLLVFVDRFDGDTSLHEFELRWTLDRAWDYYAARSGARLIHSTGAEARVVTTVDLGGVRGGADAGWCAPVYGQLLQTWTLVGKLRAVPPVEVVTAFSDGSVPPALHVEHESGAVKIAIDRGGRDDVLRLGQSGLIHEPRVFTARSSL
jgi:heparinase II/III-like protein